MSEKLEIKLGGELLNSLSYSLDIAEIGIMAILEELLYCL